MFWFDSYLLFKISVTHSGQAGFRYNPSVASSLQTDIVSWLDIREQPELEANNVYAIPTRKHNVVQVFESQLNQRKFLVAKYTEECPMGWFNVYRDD